MTTFEVDGFYGTRNRAIIYCAKDRRGGTWYAAEGSTNINYTFDELIDGVNIESLHDVDSLSADNPVNSTEDLVNEIQS